VKCEHCKAEVHDGTYLCTKCLKTLEVALGNVSALAGDLDSARLRGVKTSRSVPGSKPPPGFDLGPEEGEVQLLDAVRNEISGWVRISVDTWPHLSWPRDTVPAMCGHLMGILTAIAGQDWSDDLLRAMTWLERRVKRAADPEPRIFAGMCFICACVYDESPLYAHVGDKWVRCPADDCEAVFDVAECRTTMVADLDTRLCTAAEIATLATYLDLLDDRERVRNRINQWGKRGLIEPHMLSVEGEPMYRFGEVTERILAADATRRSRRKGA
jgi:hypothetical protein